MSRDNAKLHDPSKTARKSNDKGAGVGQIKLLVIASKDANEKKKGRGRG